MKVMTGTQHLRVGVALFVGAALVGCGPDTPPAPPPPKVEPRPAPAAPAPVVVPKPAPQPAAAAPAPVKHAETLERAGWKLLGQQQADRKGDRDRFVVGADKGQGSYREIQIVVEGAPLDVDSMVVTFVSGEQFKPALRHSFKANSHSPVIDLPREKRRIQHIDLVYRTVTAQQGKATVKIYGR